MSDQPQLVEFYSPTFDEAKQIGANRILSRIEVAVEVAEAQVTKGETEPYMAIKAEVLRDLYESLVSGTNAVE